MVKFKPFKPQVITIVLGALFLWGLVLRVYKLGEQSLWIDESFTINAALSILKHGYPLMTSGNLYLAMPVATYLTSLSFLLLGVSEWASRLPFALLGAVSIPVMYILGKKVWSKQAGLIAAALTCFFPLHIAWSRNCRGYIALFLFIALSLYYLFRYVEKPSGRLAALLTLSTIGAILSHHFGLVLVPVYLMAAFMYGRLPHTPKDWLLLSAGGLLLAAYMLLRVRIQNMLTWTGLSTFYMEQYWGFITNDIFLLFSISSIGWLYLLQKQWKKALLFVLLFLFLFYFLSFHILLLHFRYLFVAYPILIVLAGICLAQLNEFLPGRWVGQLLIIGVVVALGAGSFTPSAFHPLEFLTPQPDFRTAYGHVHLTENDIVISAYTTLSHFYLNRSDYWLAFSLSGIDINNSKPNYYTGEPPVNSAEQLRNLTARAGWVVTDNLAMQMLPKDMTTALSETSELVYYDLQDASSGVFVYRFPK